MDNSNETKENNSNEEEESIHDFLLPEMTDQSSEEEKTMADYTLSIETAAALSGNRAPTTLVLAAGLVGSLPLLIWSAFYVFHWLILPYAILLLVVAPVVAMALQDSSALKRWLAGFFVVVLLAGIKTSVLMQSQQQQQQQQQDDANATSSSRFGMLAAMWFYATTALWECSNAVLIFGGRKLLQHQFGIVTYRHALLAALVPAAQVKFRDQSLEEERMLLQQEEHNGNDGDRNSFSWTKSKRLHRWCTRSLHIVALLLGGVALRELLRAVGTERIEAIPILEAEALVLLVSSFVVVLNLPSHVWQLLVILGAMRTDNDMNCCPQIIYPYGLLYLAPNSRAFWSRWSRPASQLVRYMFYYPLGGPQRAWLSIPILFFLNAHSHYDLSGSLVGNQHKMAWNIVFGVLGVSALLEVLTKQYNVFRSSPSTSRNNEEEAEANESLEQHHHHQQQEQGGGGGEYCCQVVCTIVAHVAFRVAAYVLVHGCLELSLSSMVD